MAGADHRRARRPLDHPANFGRLCTKGSTLHLTASASVHRQTRLLQPMQRLQRGAAPVPLSPGTAHWTAPRSAWHAIWHAHGPTPSACTARARCADRGLLRLQQAGEGPAGQQPPGHQLAPVHVQRGGRLQGHAGCRCPALQLRGPRRGPDRVHQRQQPGLGPSHPVSPAGRRPARQTAGAEVGSWPTRAAPKRPRWPTCTCPAARAAMWRCTTACCT